MNRVSIADIKTMGTSMNHELYKLIEEMKLNAGEAIQAMDGKVLIEPIQYQGIEELDVKYESLQSKILESAMMEIRNKREEQIIERLEKIGFKFENKDSFYQFAKARLTLVTSERQPNYFELYLDQRMLVASWWNTFKFDHEGQRFSILSGEPE